MTIIEAVKEVMIRCGHAMTVAEIYTEIIARNLYTFHADDPRHVVATAIRRHCIGLVFPAAAKNKSFQIIDDNKYFLLNDQPKEVLDASRIATDVSPAGLLADLRSLHQKYQEAVTQHILKELQHIEPETFEHFCQHLLRRYGFSGTAVTSYSKDGGIDGHGTVRVGLADMRVAFQCKRWTGKAVGRPEIAQFRGSIQGKVEQGYLFTTGKFASGTESESFQPGAVPIVLIDGLAIVRLMIERQFGVEVDSLPIYSYALDLELGDDD
jgi:restriction system protein